MYKPLLTSIASIKPSTNDNRRYGFPQIREKGTMARSNDCRANLCDNVINITRQVIISTDAIVVGKKMEPIISNE